MATRNIGSVVLKTDSDAGQPQIETDIRALAALITDGKLPVTASGVELTATSITLDTEDITGAAPNNKTLADVTAAVVAQGAGALATEATVGTLALEAGGNLATLAGTVTSSRVAVDLATTPTANLATLATAVSTLKAATDIIGAAATLAKETGGNLATVATAVGTLKAATDIIGTAATLAKETGGNLAAIAGDVSNADYVVSVAKKIVCNGTTAVLPTAMGVTLPADLLRLIFIPGKDNAGPVCMEIGGAAVLATSPEVGTVSVPIAKTVADTIQVIGANADTLTVLTCIARA